MNLRPYQTEALRQIVAEYRNGVTKQLAVLATGLGKAVMAASLPSAMGIQRGKRVMFLVHRDELAYQAVEKFQRCNPEMSVGMEKADHRSNGADIVVASIQTVGKLTGSGGPCDRLRQFRPDDFAIVQCDEAHHVAKSKQWEGVLRHLRCLKRDPGDDRSKLLCGWTATPSRGDSIGLEVAFDKITVNYGIRDGIKAGWLANIVAYRVETSVDVSKVSSTAGDFTVPDLAKTVDTPERNRLVAEKYNEICPGKPAIFFTVDIAHSVNLATELRRCGIKAYPVSGKTPDEERKRLIRLFKDGAIDGLVSCAVLSEGTDLPNAEAGFMCRPTKSGLLFRQQIGRIMRPFPAPEEIAVHRLNGTSPVNYKQNAIIVDFCDVSGKHSLITTPSLFMLRAAFDAKGKDLLKQVEEIERLEQEHPSLDLRSEPNMEAIHATLRSVDLLAPPAIPKEIQRISKFGWLADGPGGYRLGLMDHRILTVRENSLGGWELWEHSNGIAKHLETGPSMKDGISLAEKHIPADHQKVLKNTAKWKLDPPTDAQARRIFQLDFKVRKDFQDWTSFYRTCKDRYESGDNNYSKGSLSRKIDSLMAVSPR